MRQRDAVSSAEDVVGRDREIAQIGAFLELMSRTTAALVLEGAAGIGKTTLWKHAVDCASQRQIEVLACRPVRAEQALSYGGLGDLLADVPASARTDLPAAPRHALEVVLLLEEVGPSPPDARSVAAGLLGVVRHLAADRPVLLAVDDVQWLDAQTLAVLAFAVRRLGDAPVGVLLGVRAQEELDAPLGLRRVLPEERLLRLPLSGLSIGAVHHLLQIRLGRAFPRPWLRRIHDTSGGNPFYALELGRGLTRVGALAPGDPLPLPQTLQGLVADRLAALEPAVVEVLRVVTLLAEARLDVVEAVTPSPTAIDDAIAAGVLERTGDRVRCAHPLLASAVDAGLGPQTRRRLHVRLAELVDDPERRARHLALAVTVPDRDVAAAVDEAVAHAAARGAPEAAAELSELAAARTPADDVSSVVRRLRAAAEHHLAAGDPARARGVLESLIARLPPGEVRAAVLLQLAGAVGDDLGTCMRLCGQALAEAGEDAALRARITLQQATFAWLAGRLAESAEHCRVAVGFAEQAGDQALLAMALGEVAHAETVLGQPVPRAQLAHAATLVDEASLPLYLRPTFQLGVLLAYTDELDEARVLLSRHLAHETSAGDAAGRAGVLFRLAELELRAGRWAKARAHADEAAELSAQASIEQEHAVTLNARAMVRSHLGDVGGAQVDAMRALALAEAGGDEINVLRSRGVLGFAALSLGDAANAHAWLAPATRRIIAMGVGELSIHGVLENDLEALVALGELDAAAEIVELLDRKGRATTRAWALATAARGHGLIASARGDVIHALGALEDALVHHARSPQPFPLGRTLLVKGAAERRAKRRRESRATLERARALFSECGAALWLARADSELRRLGGRTPAGSALTDTEVRVATLVAQGLSNRAVAAALFVSDRTVEGHLSRIYGKLGVHTRTELARRLTAERTSPGVC